MNNMHTFQTSVYREVGRIRVRVKVEVEIPRYARAIEAALDAVKLGDKTPQGVA